MTEASTPYKVPWPKAMDREIGEAAYREFLANLGAYRQALSVLPETGAPDAKATEAVRARGKALTDFATNLLSARRARIHDTIRHSVALPLAFAAIFLVVTIAVVALVTTRVLRPLTLLRETTRRVGQGDFRPVPLRADLTDEISGLMSFPPVDEPGHHDAADEKAGSGQEARNRQLADAA